MSLNSLRWIEREKGEKTMKISDCPGFPIWEDKLFPVWSV